MRRRFLMSGSGVFMLIIAFIFNLSFTKESQAKAYEFWGTAATIRCVMTMPKNYQGDLVVSYNGAAVVGKATVKADLQTMLGTETTCNGFRMTACGGTNCVPNEVNY